METETGESFQEFVGLGRAAGFRIVRFIYSTAELNSKFQLIHQRSCRIVPDFYWLQFRFIMCIVQYKSIRLVIDKEMYDVFIRVITTTSKMKSAAVSHLLMLDAGDDDGGGRFQFNAFSYACPMSGKLVHARMD